jgi:hypothetical protein
MKLRFAPLAACAAVALAHASDAWLDQVERALSVSALNSQFRARLSGELTAEGYLMSRPTPGLVFTESRAIFAPRLALLGDAQLGRQLYGFAQVRIDRGFDPSNSALRGRIDELALRVTPWSDGRLSLQAGQFATVIGSWAPRHDPRDNPFVTAPLPYEHLTTIYDGEAPLSAHDFVAFDNAEKYDYNPIIWGPSYATGLALAGRAGRFTFAAEVKNSGPSAHPHAWVVTRTGFEHPAVAGRIGFQPDLRWKFGLSASDSIYFLPAAAHTLPPGRTRSDYREHLVGADAAFAWGHVQVWAELFLVRFDVPRVGEVRTAAGYVEAKYKLTPQLFGALRLNRQDFTHLTTVPGEREPWARDIWRIDAATGYRFTARIDGKIQASLEHHRDSPRGPGLNVAGQFNVRF